MEIVGRALICLCLTSSLRYLTRQVLHGLVFIYGFPLWTGASRYLVHGKVPIQL
jgi:hypothetical protein